MSCEQYYTVADSPAPPPPPPPPPSVSSPCSIPHHAVAIGPSGDGSSSVSVTGRPEKNTTALPVTFALILRSAAICLHIICLPNISVRLRSHPPRFVALRPSFWPRSRLCAHTTHGFWCPLGSSFSPAPAPNPPSIPLQTERPLIYRRRPVSGGRRSRPPLGSGRSPRPAYYSTRTALACCRSTAPSTPGTSRCYSATPGRGDSQRNHSTGARLPSAINGGNGSSVLRPPLGCAPPTLRRL